MIYEKKEQFKTASIFTWHHSVGLDYFIPLYHDFPT